MKTVLCYGDSNTWGANPDPAERQRFAPDVRWTGVLQRELGDGYRVIEEGLNGRTTRWDDPIELHRNGLTYLVPCLESHQPLDMVIIMLGTNDLKSRFSVNVSDIAQSAAGLARITKQSARTADDTPPVVLLMSPPPISTLTDFGVMFDGALEKSRQFAHYYRLHADRQGVAFFDAGSVIQSSDLDGIHFEADQHGVLGTAVAGEVRRHLGG